MRRKILCVIAVLAAAMLVPAAKADTTDYTLTFNSSNSASYVWNSTTDAFSNFIVTSQFGTLNITAEADAADDGLTTSGEQAMLLSGTGYWKTFSSIQAPVFWYVGLRS
jgi:hypothetical protein